MSKYYQITVFLLFFITLNGTCHSQFNNAWECLKKTDRTSVMQTRYATEAQEVGNLKEEGQINQAEIQKQKNIRNFAIILAILALAVTILTYHRLKLKKKRLQNLQEKVKHLREANERLRDSEYNQRELNSTKDKFFSMIAHDLKSPFQGLFGISEVVYRSIDTMDKEEIKEYTKTIYDTSNNLYNLLENLLQWSRTQLGTLKLNPESLNIKEETDEIIELLIINIEEKNIQVKNEVDDGISAYADRNVLRTIMRNLLSNAIKFTEEQGEVTIQAETESTRTIISISDTGQGIPEEQRNNLFKTQTHQHEKETSGEQGTGLGLILCKELVEQSKGNIWAESKVGEGSTFKFTLPRKK